MNYYNDNDPFCCKWLRNLIDDGLIPKGDIDDRSIAEIKPSELNGYTQHHFFCGIGGWPYALRLAGWPDDRPVWTGSCPCQPFSVAGKGGGLEDERHLWPAFRWLIAQRRPAIVFGEQVASPAGREWLAGVRTDLEVMGYEVGAADLCAAGLGAPHIRQRLFWVADSIGTGLEGRTRLSECRGQQPFGQGSTSGSPRGLENTMHNGRRRRDDGDPIWSERASQVERHGAFGRMADTDSGRQQQRNEGKRRLSKPNTGSPWHDSALIPCADGKWRRVPIRVANTECSGCNRAAIPIHGEEQGQVSMPSWRSADCRVAESESCGRQLQQTNARINGEVESKGELRESARGNGNGCCEREDHFETQPLFQFVFDGLPADLGPDGHQSIIEAMNCFPLADGIPGRVGLLRGAGNAIVPAVAAEFIRAFLETQALEAGRGT